MPPELANGILTRNPHTFPLTLRIKIFSRQIIVGDIISKLEGAKEKTVLFNKETFGNIFKRRRQLEAILRGVHKQLDNYPASNTILLE
ncbi:hypothetical protein JHK86_033866 [Glycine max]|nr:hypothetical protein JHK86_033866 [Glycine max]